LAAPATQNVVKALQLLILCYTFTQHLLSVFFLKHTKQVCSPWSTSDVVLRSWSWFQSGLRTLFVGLVLVSKTLSVVLVWSAVVIINVSVAACLTCSLNCSQLWNDSFNDPNYAT